MRAVLAINPKRNRDSKLPRKEERIGNYGVEWSVRGWIVGSVCRIFADPTASTMVVVRRIVRTSKRRRKWRRRRGTWSANLSCSTSLGGDTFSEVGREIGM